MIDSNDYIVLLDLENCINLTQRFDFKLYQLASERHHAMRFGQLRFVNPATLVKPSTFNPGRSNTTITHMQIRPLLHDFP